MSRLQRGFTLLELLVVIVIIGLLAGYVAPRYFSQVGKSETQVARAQIDSLEKALDHYRLEHRRYPSTEEGLAALGPFLKKAVPNDPWGRPYSYASSATGYVIAPTGPGGSTRSELAVRHRFTPSQRMLLEGGLSDRNPTAP